MQWLIWQIKSSNCKNGWFKRLKWLIMLNKRNEMAKWTVATDKWNEQMK